ncbi:MAG: SDR family oxidoreductase [Pseudomonadota bacterium]
MSLVLVTGASSGIGAATARCAAAQGFDIGVHYRGDREGAEAVAADVEAAGRRAVLLQADVANGASVKAMFDALDATGLPLSGLVNNAGIVPARNRAFTEITDAEVEEVLAINVLGAFRCARHAVERMREAGGGSIVNVSSSAARLGAPDEYVDYAASKGAIDTMTIGLAKEVAPLGIRVTGVRPGLIETPIHAKGGQPDRIRRLAGQVPMARGGTAEEVAQTIVFLLSEQASYVTGSILDVSGGR